MDRKDQLQLTYLYAELARVELQLEDKNLSHSDQQLLNQAWEDITNQIDDIEAGVEEDFKEEEWTGRLLEEDDEDDMPRLIRIAPPPPSPEDMSAAAAGSGITIAPPHDIAEEDDRGCENCAGCVYCEEPGQYDPAGEI